MVNAQRNGKNLYLIISLSLMEQNAFSRPLDTGVMQNVNALSVKNVTFFDTESLLVQKPV